MRKCCIKGCSKRKSTNKQKITLHRFPTNENKRNEWVNLIGKENIDMSLNKLNICSLHFKESSFNRTLTITRLRDDAVPHKNLVPKSRLPEYNTDIDSESDLGQLEDTNNDSESDEAVAGPSKLGQLEDTNNDSDCEEAVPGPSKPSKSKKPDCITVIVLESDLGQLEDIYNKSVRKELVPGPSKSELDAKTIIKLKQKCENQKRKIKRLNESVRRLKIKVAGYKTTIFDLNKRILANTDYITELEE